MTDNPDITGLPYYQSSKNLALRSGLSADDMRCQAGQFQAWALRHQSEASAVAAQAWFDAAEQVATGNWIMERAA